MDVRQLKRVKVRIKTGLIAKSFESFTITTCFTG